MLELVVTVFLKIYIVLMGLIMNKLFSSADSAIFDIKDNSIIMSGGFGLCGNPENLISAIYRKNIKNLTIISNNCGTMDHGLGVLLKNKQIKKMISSYVGENSEFEKQFLNGELEVELIPQGTLAEKIRANGSGIPAFYTATGVGTQVADGGIPMLYGPTQEVVKVSKKKETRFFNEKEYVLEAALSADFAIIKAYKSDTFGNLIFRKTARNFNPEMCMAAKTTLVEVEHVVDIGELDPDEIHLPGAYVDRIIHGKNYKKLIEKLTTINT